KFGVYWMIWRKRTKNNLQMCEWANLKIKVSERHSMFAV
ncbi:MAG: hypothetical protein ACI81T_001860, partial [Bacteroidia bacterium]